MGSAKADVLRERARAERLGTSATAERGRREAPSNPVAALGNGEARVLEFEMFRSAEIGRTHLARDAREHARVFTERAN